MVTGLTTGLFIFGIFLLIYIKKEDDRKNEVMESIDNMMRSTTAAASNIFFVNRIIDGDTIVVNDTLHVRLENIDAYESDSPIHGEIMDFLNNLILNKNVKIIFSGNDKYNRTLGTVYLTNGINLNMLMVEKGYARVYTEYCDKSSAEYEALVRAEEIARFYRFGAWSMLLNAPWVDRHQ